MLIYVLSALASLIVAAFIVFLTTNARRVVDNMRHWTQRKAVQRNVRLHHMRYMSPSRTERPPAVEVRHTPHPSRPPSPVFDGKFRRPWGW